ncbi:MAG: alpha/beta fold hydrolase [Clostridia bacterium]|nr:alpha/beta fold hydrolase [Clostridia bacterium]
MEYTVKHFKVLSCDKTHYLHSVAYIPDGEIKGIFHLVHGMTEYIERYENFMAAIACRGFICCGYDNLGHGKTASDSSELGFIAEKNGYEFLVEDVRIFADFMKKEFDINNYVLMGHSMGSFIARTASEKYENDFSKLIICGTSGPNPLSNIGIILCHLLVFLKGTRGYSSFLENLVFGSYNKRFSGDTKYEWLSSDKTVIDKYINDKYCTFRFTISALLDLIRLNAISNKSSWFKNLRNDIPILIVSGEEDPVGNYGKGVNEVYKKLIKCKKSDVSLKLYKNCRHEIHNDTCKEQMMQDIFDFIL